MTITPNLDPELQASLIRIAAERGQSVDEFIGDVMREYIEYWNEFREKPGALLEADDDAGFIRAVEEGIAQADRGETISNEEAKRRTEEALRRLGA